MTRLGRGLAGLVAALCALAATGCAPDPGTRPRTSLDDGVLQSDQLLTRFLGADAPGCSAAVMLDGELVWAGARGLADREIGTPLTPSTEFDFASVSKQFTGAAVLQLVDEGMLALDDRLGDLLDGLPAWADAVTVDDLLHHRSGIPDYTGLLLDAGHGIDDVTTQDDAVAAIAESSPDAEPGEEFAYSNSNYVLLASIVETVTGEPFADRLGREVFAGHDLRLDPLAASETMAARYEDGERATTRWSQVGDGGVIGTPSALAAWATAYAGDSIGDHAVVAAMTRDAVPDGTGSAYGAGIIVAPDGSLSHAGGWVGHVTLFGVSADRSTVIAVTCNETRGPIGSIAEGLRRVWVL